MGHRSPPGHPERPERLVAVRDGLARAGFAARGTQVPVRRVREEEIGLVHTAAYLSDVSRAVPGHSGYLDEDTFYSPGSWDAALAAAGVAVDLTRASLDGQFARGFGVVRPPGHHAEPDRAMGFCILNNVAIAAADARARGAARVAIVDWDVHHGNGTQALMEHEPTIRYVSLHQHPWYPGTGMAEERGVGNVFNVPRGPGAPPQRYVDDLWAAIVAATADWTPDLVLVSAGFDAMRGDPLGGFTLEPQHFAEWTRRLRERLPEAPVVGLLEGGYVPARVAEGVLAHVLALA